MAYLHAPQDLHDFVCEVIDGDLTDGNKEKYYELAKVIPPENFTNLRELSLTMYLEGFRDGLRLMDAINDRIR